MHTSEIEKQAIQTFYRNNKYGWIASIILFSALLLIMQATFTPLLIMYFALLVPYLAFHITNHMMFNQAVNEAEFNIKTWRRSATVISAYIGLLIGSLPVKYLDLSQPTTTYIICAILVLTMFGSSVLSATCRRVHLIWSITSLAPVAFLLLLTDNFEYIFLGAVMLLIAIPAGIILASYNRHT